MGRIIIVTISAVLLVAALSFLPQDAHAATNIDLKDQASCESLPSGSPSWDLSTSTCTVTNLSLTLDSGDSLTVENGVSLVIDTGTIDNSGTMNIPGQIHEVSSSITNEALGQMNISPSGVISFEASNLANLGKVNNQGRIDGHSASYSNSGEINIQGATATMGGEVTFTNNAGGIINIDDSGTLFNLGFVINNGIINNHALINNVTDEIDNNSGGTINNSGTIRNFHGLLNNFGTINNEFGGIIDNSGTIHNSGTINNCSGTIDNSGTIDGNPIVNTCNQDTTTTITSSLNPSVFSQLVTFTVTVTSSGGTPTGTVTFNDGAVSIGSGTLDSTGHATLSVSTLSAGTHSINAVYLGDSNFNPSTSPELSQVVLTPSQAVDKLANLAHSMGLKSSELDSAQKLLDDSNQINDNGACGKLGAFINTVNADKSLTGDQSDTLIGLANDIMTAIGC